MSAGGDDHDDDAQLRQLRAVWVSMRDEDPPDRGLSALMAAAREKAAELEQAASPSWWQRVVATLRLPPVLALATVTLLLGGALFITQRSAEMKADAVVETEGAAPVSAPGPVTDNAVQPMGGDPGAGSAAIGVRAPAATVPREEAESATPHVVAERPEARDSKPTPKPKPPTNTTTSTTKLTNDDALGRKAPEPSEAAKAGRGGGAPPALEIAQDPAPVVADSAPRDEAATPKSPAKKPIARKDPPSIEGEDRQMEQDSAKPVKPSLDQLVKQCETAAARGDCAAARLIAQKILTSFPAAYKQRVANNAAIHRCLPSAADNASAAE